MCDKKLCLLSVCNMLPKDKTKKKWRLQKTVLISIGCRVRFETPPLLKLVHHTFRVAH